MKSPQIYGGPWDGADVPKSWREPKVSTTFLARSGSLHVYLRREDGAYIFVETVKPEKAAK